MKKTTTHINKKLTVLLIVLSIISFVSHSIPYSELTDFEYSVAEGEPLEAINQYNLGKIKRNHQFGMILSVGMFVVSFILYYLYRKDKNIYVKRNFNDKKD